MKSNTLFKAGLFAILAAIFIFLLIMCVRECESSKKNIDPNEVELREQAEDLGFVDASSVVAYQDLLLTQREADSIFLSIPPPVLRDIAKVLIKKQGSVTTDECIEEYKNNGDIYTSLAENNETAEDLVNEESPTPLATPSATDTVIINGKKYISHESDSNDVHGPGSR